MRVLLIISVIVILCPGCDMNSSNTKARVDSTVTKLDSAFKKIENKADAVWDSTKAKANDLKNDIDSTFDRKKDSTKN